MELFEVVRVCSYIRVSGNSQVERDGPERQREAIAAFCAKFGLFWASESFERAVSGTVDAVDRPAFARLLEFIDSRANDPALRISAIVVERMDRLARDLMVSEFLLAELRKRGVKVFSADQGVLIDMAAEGCDPTRVLIRQILGALSQWEKSMLVAKLKAARERKKARTGRCEGKLKYGSYPGETEIINIIHNFRSTLDIYDQPMEYQRIAALLNESGFRTRHGHEWKFGTVKHICNTTTPTKIMEITT